MIKVASQLDSRHNKQGAEMPPYLRGLMKLSFIVVNSRGDAHPDWVDLCVHSIVNQDDDDAELIVVDNIGRKMTIGKAFNEGVKQASGDWCVFVGDDDIVEQDYTKVLRKGIDISRGQNIVSVATYMTAFDNDTGNHFPMTRQSTGAWKRDYLLKYPFNENLEKGIDREYIEETQKRGDLIFIIKYYFGYYYRRHQDYRCAGDVIFHKEPSDYYFVTTNRIFLSPITDRIKGSVFVDTNFDYELAKRAKTVWVEWANEKAIEVSNIELPAKKILRIHAYEAFTEYAYKINWNGFDKVVFIDKYIKDYVERQFGKVNGAVIIPNGVDLQKFTFKKKEKNNKIAYAGYLTRKKGIGELLLIAKSLPDYEFHLAGRYQENDIADWVAHKKPDNVFIHEWKYAEAMNEFYQDKSFIISTSLRESQAMSLMEGMACGCRPLVNDWIGAEDIYGKDYIFKNIQDIEKMLKGSFEPEKYRKFIEDNYSFDNVYPQIEELII